MFSLAELLGLEPEPVPKMFTRLETIEKYFIACEIGDPRLTVIENKPSYGCRTIHFKFYTKQGPVEIVLFKTFLVGNLAYEMDYTTYSGVRLFKVSSTQSKVYVEPCMGYSYNIDAKDIDLAILELENYLYDNYGDINNRWEQYQLEEQLAQESHEQQLKELY